MHRTLVALALVATPALARADGEDEDPKYRYDYEPSSVLGGVFAPANGFSAGLFAGIAGVAGRDKVEPTVMVGGHLATPGVTDSCRYLQVEGGYALAENGGANGSAEVCLFRAGKLGVVAPGLTVRQDLAYDARPTLSASRSVLRRRYTGGALTIDGSVMEGMNVPDYGSALLTYRVELDQLEQDNRRQRKWGLAIDIVRYIPPRAIVFQGSLQHPETIVSMPADELSFMGVFIRESWEGRLHVTAGGLMLVRILGLEVDDLTLDVEAKIGAGDVWEYDEMGMPSGDLASVMTPTGLLGVGGTRSWFDWTTRYARELEPTFDGALMLEDRFDASVELRRGVPRLAFTGFTARTALYGSFGMVADWTGGATVSRPFELGERLSLVLAAEAARSWYATVDGDARPRPEPAARAWATVAATL